MNISLLKNKLVEFANEIKDEKLREKVKDFLNIPRIKLSGYRLSLDECPGGAYVHHTYKGGLIQHTAAVTSLSLNLCDSIEEMYGGTVDRDKVIAGALLHDVMKCYVYTHGKDGGFMTSTLGEKIDHLTLLISEMYREGFPLDVIHVVAAHHGQQGPVKPRTIEALIVSVADLADSDLNRQTLRAAEYLISKTTGGKKRFQSSEEVLNIIKIKADKGWEGLKLLQD